jgi:hypothetical protein
MSKGYALLNEASSAVLMSDPSDWGSFDMDEYCGYFDQGRIGLRQVNSPGDKITRFGSAESSFGSDRGIQAIMAKRSFSKKENRLLSMIMDVEPLTIPGMEVYKDWFVEYDRKSKWTQPVDWRTLSDVKSGPKMISDRELAYRRAAQETPTYHFHAPPQTLLVLRMAAGREETKDNVMLRYLRFYLDTVFQGEEAFIEGQNGLLDMKKGGLHSDTCAVSRVSFLMNMFALMQDFKHRNIDERIFTEYAAFILKNPAINTVLYKSATAVLKQSFLCLSTQGIIPGWTGSAAFDKDPVINGFEDTVIEMADLEYYEYVKSKIKEDLIELRSLGLKFIADTFESLLSAKADQYSCFLYVVLEALQAQTGYSRSEESITNQESINERTELAPDFSPDFIKDIKMEWHNAIEWGHLNNRIMNYDEFRRVIPGYLTTKSSGGFKVIYSVPKNSQARRLRGEDDRQTFRFTDKRSVFYARPDSALDPTAVRSNYDMITPGRTATRHVAAGKDTRAVFPRRIAHYLHEIPVAQVVQDYQMQKETDDAAWGSADDFTIGKENGIVLHDHAGSALATVNPLVFCDATDFKAFDQHQREQNCRKYAREQLIEDLTNYGYNKPWGGFAGGLVELITILWGQGHTVNAIFITEGLDGDVVLTLDMLQSGELMTITFNNFTNRANMRSVLRQLETDRKVSEAFKLRRVKLMGDDGLKFWSSPATGVSNEAFASFIDISVAATESNGLSMNKFKSVMRRTHSEYLQKKFVHGMFIPKLWIQLLESERPAKNIHPVERFTGYANTMAAYIFRGGEPGFRWRLLQWSWAIKASLKVPITYDISSQMYLPMAALFLPKKFGGCGILPFSHAGASTDVVVCLLAKTNPSFNRVLANAGGVMSVDPTRVSRTLSQLIVEGEETEPKYIFKPGVEYVRSIMSKKRVVNAMAARRRLDSVRAPLLGNLYYINMPEVLIKDSIENNNNIKFLDTLKKLDTGEAMLKMAKGKTVVDISQAFPWLNAVIWTDGEVLKPRSYNCTPFPLLDDKSQELTKILGFSTDRSSYEISGSVFINKLKFNDPHFPRHLQPEAIFAYITQPSIIYDVSRITDALIAMGAEPSKAQQVATEVGMESKSFAFRQNANGYSLNDSFLPNLSNTFDTHKRVVDLFALPENNDFTYLMYEVGMLYSITKFYMSGEFRQTVILPTDTSFADLSKALMGGLGEPDVLKYQKMYGNTAVSRYGQN